MEWIVPVVLVVLVAVLVPVLVLVFRSEARRNERQLDAWRRFASEGGHRWFEPSGPWYRRASQAIEGEIEGIPFRIDTYVVSTGKSAVTYTRICGKIERPLSAKVLVTPRMVFTRLVEALGWRTISTGDPAFDRKMAVRSKSPDMALRVLDDGVRARALEVPRSFQLQCLGSETKAWWTGAEADAGVLESASRLVAAFGRACARA